VGQFVFGKVGLDGRPPRRVGQMIVAVRLLGRTDGSQPLKVRCASCRSAAWAAGWRRSSTPLRQMCQWIVEPRLRPVTGLPVCYQADSARDFLGRGDFDGAHKVSPRGGDSTSVMAYSLAISSQC